MNGTRNTKNGVVTWLALALGLAGCADTTDAGSGALSLEGDALGAPPQEGPCRAPPPEALEACADKAAGEVCTISLPDREVTGACVTPPEGPPDDRLVCRPDEPAPPPPDCDDRQGPPPPDGDGPHGPPPPEALTACQGLEAGGACTVEVDGHDPVSGTCLSPPWDAEGPLACVPARRHGG